MPGVRNFKIGSKVLEKFTASLSLFRVCLRTFHQPVNGSSNPLQNTGNYLQWTQKAAEDFNLNLTVPQHDHQRPPTYLILAPFFRLDHPYPPITTSVFYTLQ